MKYAFPDNYGEDCIVLCLDKSLVPLVSGALKPFEQSYSWISDEDYEQGYNAFAQVQASFMNNCLQELIESNRQIYRLLDSGLNGRVYTTAPDPLDPTKQIAVPAIPVAPQAFNPTTAIGSHALRLIIQDMATRDEVRRVQLEALLLKLDQIIAEDIGEDLTEIITKLASILALL